jgi:hypothetical protein
VISSDLARALLGCPRGRRLCLDLSGIDPVAVLARLSAPPRGSRQRIRWSEPVPYSEVVLERIAALIRDRWTGDGRDRLDHDDLWSALDLAAAFATYWQPPEENDLVAADPSVLTELALVAEAVAAHPLAERWTHPVEAGDQLHVGWTDQRGRQIQPPDLTGTAARLAHWRATVGRPGAPGSQWWSVPAPYGIVATTASIPGGIPAGLVFVEDAQGWTRARVTPLRPSPGARVLELAGPGDWTDLVRRHPIDVTRSHAQAWHDVTGRDGPWLIPDWAAVATEYDGVHLTIMGYLTAAGRAWEIGGGLTLLGGWDPDATYWLTDCLEQVGPASTWFLDADDDASATFGWREALVR